MGKIKEFINKIIDRIDSIVFGGCQLDEYYSCCYGYHEGISKAVFGMCVCNDMNCPYNANVLISLYPDMKIKLFKIDSNTTKDVVNKWLDRITCDNTIIESMAQIDDDGYEHILIMYRPNPCDYSYSVDMSSICEYNDKSCLYNVSNIKEIKE